MNKDDNLEILVDALNISDKLHGQEFNVNPIIIDAYISLYGEEKYQDCIAHKNYNIVNAFYSLTLTIENEITDRNIPTTIAKYYSDKIKNEITRNHMLFFIVDTAVNRNEIEYAEELTSLLTDNSPVSASYHGYRLILKYYALKADLDNFRKYLKLSKSAKFPKGQVIEAKKIMLSAYSVKKDIAAGLKLCKERVFGLKNCMSIIENQAKKFSLREIDGILENHPVFLEYEPNAKAILYVKRLSANHSERIVENDFETTLNEVIKVDKSIKNEGIRLKDYLLFELGSSMPTSAKAQIITCKKMITAPFYKKELSYRLD